MDYQMVVLNPGNIIGFTNSNGYYSFSGIVAAGTYTVDIVLGAGSTSLCPSSNSIAVNVTSLGHCYSGNNFYVTNPPVQDLMIDIFHVTNATPGFEYRTRVKYKNKGNTIMSGTLDNIYNPLLGFHSVINPSTTLDLHDIPNHKFDWSFTNLQPGESRYVYVDFMVPTSATLGTVLNHTGTILPLVGDAVPADNTDADYTTIVGSWDPNDKRVWPFHSNSEHTGGIIYPNEEELTYAIRFQNTGTAPAFRVVVRDTLDAYLLPETVKNIETSHDAVVTVEDGHILVFTFDNIYLPDSSADFLNSIGYIKFNIDRTAGLALGTEIPNTSAIYFDFNTPVITNTVISTIGEPTAVTLVDADFDFQVMPNPFGTSFTVQFELEKDAAVGLTMFNALGAVVYTQHQELTSGVQQTRIEAADLVPGIYFLQVATPNGQFTKKIVKR